MNKEDLSLYIDQHSAELFGVAQDLYDNPEISEHEENSSEMFKRLLKENGFTIHEFDQDELKYAFYAEYGSGHPVVAMLASTMPCRACHRWEV
jgi:aminobenzoyl-glutamate utilization protein B